MENLNSLIWTDEDTGIGTQSIDYKPMKEMCILVFCTIKYVDGSGGGSGGPAGNLYVCNKDNPPSTPGD